MAQIILYSIKRHTGLDLGSPLGVVLLFAMVKEHDRSRKLGRIWAEFDSRRNRTKLETSASLCGAHSEAKLGRPLPLIQLKCSFQNICGDRTLTLHLVQKPGLVTCNWERWKDSFAPQCLRSSIVR